MKTMILAILACALALVSCRDKKALRAEMQSIDKELISLKHSADRYRSERNSALISSFFGGILAGAGLATENDGLTTSGASTVNDAIRDSSHAGYSLDQIKQRAQQLASRRQQIVNELR